MPQKLKETQVPESQCPKCNASLSLATSIRESNSPEPGSLTVCIRCGAILKYDSVMLLTSVKAMEMQQVQVVDPEAYAMLKKAQFIIRRDRNLLS